ncbi:MAG: YqcI/YcgG family protein [Pseudomonadota bacterium]|nr:YqcI/YcgG family protein [Pseudomonadota bacterium]
MRPATYNSVHPLADRFRCFVERSSFPCVGAKSALARQQMRFVVARDMASAWDDLRIYPALHEFATDYRAAPKLYQSLVVLFEGPADLPEAQFERHLWARAQSLSDKDDWHGQRHDARVSADAASPHFSLSFGGEAFFIVGLHPKASRPGRRFAHPAMVFNLHDQFEQLRATGTFGKLKTAIAERDVALAGSINPMLQSHGQGSEARQYSGRAVGADWTCPFTRGGETDLAA